MCLNKDKGVVKNHLKGLDTLRALAALIVVFGHIEMVKMDYKLENLIDSNSIIFPSGHIAVILFFVLSGFLITYLLVKEIETNKEISFKKFYMRRILRIWPLYYLIIILSYLLMYESQSIRSIFLCLTIFPNVAHAIGEGWGASPQIWSIGVEEQFYLVWPILLSTIFLSKAKRILPTLLLLFFVAYTILPEVIGYINTHYVSIGFMGGVEKFFYGSKYNCMAIGAFIGIAYANNKKWISTLNNNMIFIPVGLIVFLLWFFKFELNPFTDELFSILFALIILGAIGNKTINIDNVVTKFLGKISFGIYMYHWIVLILVMNFLPRIENHFYYNCLLYLIVFSLTIFISWLSYRCIEQRFLNLKDKYRIKHTINKIYE